MNIFRVDDRLIHGQVVENWIDNFAINVIVVVNDEIANDELRKNIMKFAVPEGVEVLFLKRDDLLGLNIDNTKNYLFLFENLKDVLSSIEKGLKIDKLNLGGIHFATGRNFTLGRVVFLSEEECNILKKLISMGVDVYRQAIPQDPPVEVRGEL